MPIYEYRCTDCGHRLEALQRLADQPLLVCPVCGKESLTKLMSAVGFQLKGSGWYATDFKHSGSKPAEKGSAKSDAANEGGTSAEKSEGAAATASSGDQKAEAKTAAKPASSESKTTSTEAKSSATT
ncbi:MAG TPA: zinc ribbon domain-containing protein, partial [Casimicrobiaceae bacterium]